MTPACWCLVVTFRGWEKVMKLGYLRMISGSPQSCLTQILPLPLRGCFLLESLWALAFISLEAFLNLAILMIFGCGKTAHAPFHPIGFGSILRMEMNLQGVEGMLCFLC